MKRDIDAFAPLLIDVQTNPERDVTLESLARESGYSPSHFQRLFTDAIGESPKDHVERVRLERAAYKISGNRHSILDIAVSVGYRNHETFTRAFRRRFGMTPSAWRRCSLAAQKDRMAKKRGFRGDGCVLSDTTFLTLKPMTLLALRRIGPYSASWLPPFSEADDTFPKVAAFAEGRSLAYRRVPLVICYDDPTVTPPDLQHLDACLPLTRTSALSSRPGRGVRRLDFSGGLYGAIEHRGSYETMIQAYRTLADGIRRSTRFRFGAGPPVQIFREWSTRGKPSDNVTEVYFPVEKV
jgi:AraC family transcriptional regulator